MHRLYIYVSTSGRIAWGVKRPLDAHEMPDNCQRLTDLPQEWSEHLTDTAAFTDCMKAIGIHTDYTWLGIVRPF